MDRTPAAKIPPMPIGRTYSKKMSSAGIPASGAAPAEIAPGTQWPKYANSGTSTKNDTIEPAKMMAA